MNKKGLRLLLLIPLLMVLTLGLSACQPEATPEAAEEEEAAPAEEEEAAPAEEEVAEEEEAVEEEPAEMVEEEAPEIPPPPDEETYEEFLERIGGEDFLYAPVDTEGITIAWLGITLEHEYQRRRDTSALATAEEMGVTLLQDVYENDVVIQRQRAEDMVSRGAQAICTTARDEESFEALQDYLAENGVYLLAEGSSSEGFTRDTEYYASLVTVPDYDNGYVGGVWAAEYFLETYPDRDPVLAIGNYPTVPAAIWRADGFIAGFQSVIPDAEVVFNDGLGGGAGRDEVLPAIEDVFTAYPELNVFMSIWDEPAMAAYTTAQARGLTSEDLMIVGYDGTIEVANIVREPDSLIVADIGQNPELAGRLGVAIAARILDGDLRPEDLPLTIFEPGFLITAETVDEFLEMVGEE